MQSESGSSGGPASADYRKLLSAVLERALEEIPGDLPADEKAALVEVARRHRGRSLGEGGVLAELVAAILASHFASLGPAGMWKECAAEIAQSLLDDPKVLPRAERLWERLQEAER